ncbi:MAG: septum site-determining protein MinC, partial [Muribaculaceae bacterium]|nr:septum site-determining protein MinC [Muribaculaceae bacterium]
MKNPVIIKSFPNGLSIYLDDEMPFAQLLDEIAFKFKESAHFFKDASMALSFEGRELSDQEERQLVNAITASCSINVMCIIGKSEETDKAFVKALQKLSYRQEVMENAGQFYKGTLKDGQMLET